MGGAAAVPELRAGIPVGYGGEGARGALIAGVERHSGRVLHGDTFYLFTCAGCAEDGQERWERLQLNWTPLVQLVLYHLYWLGGRQPGAFFHWKDEVCRLVDEHWLDLIPHKQKTPAWTHSVSSTLSANPDVFVSGLLAKRAPGWWALARWAPPGTHRDRDRDRDAERDRPRAHDAPAEMSEDAARELRKDVLEKLLSVDTSLLEMAIKRARERKESEKQLLRLQAKKKRPRPEAVPTPIAQIFASPTHTPVAPADRSPRTPKPRSSR